MATARLAFPMTVLVSDSTRMGCELLCSGLTSNGFNCQVVAAGASSKSILQAVETNKPAVALVSLVLEEGPIAGLQVLKELQHLDPDIPCALLMDKPAPDIAMEAFRRGAKGVFLRSNSLHTLWHCVEVISEGQIWISSEDLMHLLDAFSTTVPVAFTNAKGEELLSQREREIVMLVMQGLTNREIARHANISVHTVKNYLLRIYDKLGVSSRAELIIYTVHRQPSYVVDGTRLLGILFSILGLIGPCFCPG